MTHDLIDHQIPQNSLICPSHIDNDHWQEWVIESRVDPLLTALNLRSQLGTTPHDYLLYSAKLPRRNNGRLSESILKQYRHLEDGGWWCSGVDVLSPGCLEESLWGCFKPNSPRVITEYNSQGFKKQKVIKYEHPPGTETGIFALRVPLHIWQTISAHYRVPMPEKIVVTENGEAVGFWAWVIANPAIPLFFTEGAKKAGALLTIGYCAIAVPGIHNAYRVPRDEYGHKTGNPFLISPIAAFATRSREVAIAYDEDAKPKTVLNVRKATFTLGLLLSQSGASVNIAQWDSQLGKGVDDVIAAHGVGKWEEIVNNAPSFREWTRRDLSVLTYESSVSPCQRFLQVKIPPSEWLIVLRSVQFTGKTQLLANYCIPLLAQGIPILILSHRETLARALSDRFGISYRTEKTPEGKLLGYSLCVDSLRPKYDGFNWEDWQDRPPIVILDECEQVIWHLLNGTTEVKKYRVPILKQFQKLIGIARQVILSDADVSNLSVDFIKGLVSTPVEPWVIHNNYQHSGWDVTLLDTAEQWHWQLLQQLASGRKLFVVTAAQLPKSKNGTLALERLIKKRFPDLRVLRIDRETIGDPHTPAYAALPILNEALKEFDVVICSPSIETGISIEIKGHFDAVWGLSTGKLPPTNFVQFLWRLRDSVPRFVHISKAGFETVGNGSFNYKTLLESQNQLVRLNLAQLREADLSPENIDGHLNPIYTRTWSLMGARLNRQMKEYRETVIDLLKAQNHRLIDTAPLPKQERKEIAKELDDNRQANWNGRCGDVAGARDLTEEQAQQLSQQRAKPQADSNAVRKHKLKQKYGGEVTPELVRSDDEGLYAKVRLEYYLSEGRQYLKRRDLDFLQSMLEDGEGAVFKPDVNSNLLVARVKALEVMGIPQLLDSSRTFLDTDEDLVKLANLANANQEQIKTLLGITLHQPKENPKTGEVQVPVMAIAKQLLALIGYDLKRSEKKIQVGDKRKYSYHLVPKWEPVNRRTVFHYWLERDQERYAQRHVTAEPNNISICPPVTDAPVTESPVTEEQTPAWAISSANVTARTTHAGDDTSPPVFSKMSQQDKYINYCSPVTKIKFLPKGTIKNHISPSRLITSLAELEKGMRVLLKRTWFWVEATVQEVDECIARILLDGATSTLSVRDVMLGENNSVLGLVG